MPIKTSPGSGAPPPVSTGLVFIFGCNSKMYSYFVNY